ncbi:hypothetical protein ACN47E_003473 [Coniothyrium glycines]
MRETLKSKYWIGAVTVGDYGEGMLGILVEATYGPAITARHFRSTLSLDHCLFYNPTSTTTNRMIHV